jgi:hypothetical protein
MLANDLKPDHPDYWPCSPEEFTLKVEYPAASDHKNAPNTVTTSPGSETDTLPRVFDLIPSTPDATSDIVSVSYPLLLTPPLTQANLAILDAVLNKPSRKNNKYAGPPAGGYQSNKLDYNLGLKQKKPIWMKDTRGPNSDLGGAREYEKEITDEDGDIIMQETIWTTLEKTSFLVSLSLSHREAAAYQIQQKRCTTVLISSTMAGIPSLVVTAPDQSILLDPITRTTASLPNRITKRNTKFDRDIPVHSNGTWAPVCAKRKNEHE